MAAVGCSDAEYLIKSPDGVMVCRALTATRSHGRQYLLGDGLSLSGATQLQHHLSL